MIVRPLTPSDVPAALRLSTQAHWNQVASDWHRLIRLWPADCLGGWIDNQLVATGTLATYHRTSSPPHAGFKAEGDDPNAGILVGWIGMILVDESYRNHGLGTAITRAVLTRAADRGVQQLGLDASPQGEPIYRRLGFETFVGINRWIGPGAIDETALIRPSEDQWSQILHLDHQACGGIDRAALLRDIAATKFSDTRWLADTTGVHTYGIVRKGRTAWHVGPLVARDTAAAARVLDDLIGPSDHKPTDNIFIDVPELSPLDSTLRARGFTIARRLKRMSRPQRAYLLTSPQTFAAAGFELG